MSGREIVARIEAELVRKNISKTQFYEDCGVSSATFSQWRNEVFVPSPKKIRVIENYLGISLREDPQDESGELREILRDRQDLRILLSSAKDMPPSSVYTLIAQFEKMKEDSQ